MDWHDLLRSEMAWRWAYVAVGTVVAVLTSRCVYTWIRRDCTEDGVDLDYDDADRAISMMFGICAGIFWGLFLPFVLAALIGELILPARAKKR